MSLDIIPNEDAVQQRDVGSISFIPLLGVAVSLLPSPKGMSIDIVNGDAVLVSIYFVPHKMLASAGSRVPASSNIVHCKLITEGIPSPCSVPGSRSGTV